MINETKKNIRHVNSWYSFQQSSLSSVNEPTREQKHIYNCIHLQFEVRRSTERLDQICVLSCSFLAFSGTPRYSTEFRISRFAGNTHLHYTFNARRIVKV